MLILETLTFLHLKEYDLFSLKLVTFRLKST